MHELRHACRSLFQSPVFTVVAILSLALAIGVNSAIFAIVNALFFRPVIAIPPEEIVNVYTGREGAERAYRNFSYAELTLLRESGEAFGDVAAFRPTTVGVAAGPDAVMERRFAFMVSDSYFSMLGAKPAAGRFFRPEEGKPNAGIPVAVASSSLWKRLGGGGEFSERTVSINGGTWNIIGVAPAGFSGGNALLAPDLWLPLGMAAHVDAAFAPTRGSRDLADPATFVLYVVARLQPGLNRESAATRLPALAARFTAMAADAAHGPRTLVIGPLSRFNFSTEPSEDGPLGLFGALLIGMAGVVLLVACLNLANMFLARNLTRAPELAVRQALGASRGRIVGNLTVEGLIIALLGGAVGLLLGSWASAFLVHSLMNDSSLSSHGFSVALDTSPDFRVLSATLVFCVAATLVFALSPAWHVTREIARGRLSLHQATRTTTDRGGRLFSGRHCLLMAQLALSLALLFTAGLFLRSAHAAARLDPGFNAIGDLVAELDYSLVAQDDDDVVTTVGALPDALRHNPAVREVALASDIPFGNVNNGFDLSTVGGADDKSRRVRGTLTAVSADYFNTIGVRLLRGRDFSAQEWRDPDGPSVVIIDERTAAALFPDQDPVGQYVEPTRRPDRPAAAPIEVIGVVSAHWHAVMANGPPPRAFFPLAQRHPRQIFVHLRGESADAVTSGRLGKLVRDELAAIDPAIPLVRLEPYPAIIDRNIELWTVRFAASLFGAFGAIALVLAVVGVYGVKAFVVARRTREFGIRLALGASPAQVYTLLMKQGAAQIAIGLGIGVLLALGAGQVLAAMLLRVSPHDPVVLAVAAVPLAVTALLATWLPARRATRVDPMQALRAE